MIRSRPDEEEPSERGAAEARPASSRSQTGEEAESPVEEKGGVDPEAASANFIRIMSSLL